MKKNIFLLFYLLFTFSLTAQERWTKIYSINREKVPYPVSTLNISPLGEDKFMLYGQINGRLVDNNNSTLINALDVNQLTAGAYVLTLDKDKKMTLSKPEIWPDEGSDFLFCNNKTYLKAKGGIHRSDTVIRISTPVQSITKNISYYGHCGTEGCTGITFLSLISNDSIKWTAHYDATLKEYITPAGNLLLASNGWDMKQDSVLVNDEYLKVTSPYFLVYLDAYGQTIKIVNEDVQALQLHPFPTQKILIGKDKIFSIGSFQDSIRINNKTYSDSGYHYFVTQYDNDLNLLWASIVGTGELTLPIFTLDEEDNLYVVANTMKIGTKIGGHRVSSFPDTTHTLYIQKIDKNGNTASVWFYPGTMINNFYAKSSNSFYLVLTQVNPWNKQFFHTNGNYLYKLDRNGQLFPNNLPLPYNTQSPLSVQDIMTYQNGLYILQTLDYGTNINGSDTITITAGPSNQSQNWLLMKVADWQFTGVEQNGETNSHIDVFYAQQTLVVKGKASYLTVYDLSGRKLYAFSLDKSSYHKLYIPLKKGAYIYSLTDDKSKSSGKFIVQ